MQPGWGDWQDTTSLSMKTNGTLFGLVFSEIVETEGLIDMLRFMTNFQMELFLHYLLLLLHLLLNHLLFL